jgi:hypothetical protein
MWYGMVWCVASFRQTNDVRLRAGPPPKPRDRVVPNNQTTYGKPSEYASLLSLLYALPCSLAAVAHTHMIIGTPQVWAI